MSAIKPAVSINGNPEIQAETFIPSFDIVRFRRERKKARLKGQMEKVIPT